ncbi:MAG TPA: hypothetical protein VFV38_03090, partial [Ktedonobacteraceae bacterium]|nr:hypothetical protein [Ktedonobacteraceae bacterium]
VIFAVVGLVKSCSANATLNEHSSCNQFAQADTATQDKVLQDMMAAHPDTQDSLTLTRASVTLYCDVHDGNSPIDGIYGDGYSGQRAPFKAQGYSHRAWPGAAV